MSSTVKRMVAVVAAAGVRGCWGRNIYRDCIGGGEQGNMACDRVSCRGQ
jgi:hypothetical protein